MLPRRRATSWAPLHVIVQRPRQRFAAAPCAMSVQQVRWLIASHAVSQYSKRQACRGVLTERASAASRRASLHAAYATSVPDTA
eukprot:2480452-Rhodomonas_salina.2